MVGLRYAVGFTAVVEGISNAELTRKLDQSAGLHLDEGNGLPAQESGRNLD